MKMKKIARSALLFSLMLVISACGAKGGAGGADQAAPEARDTAASAPEVREKLKVQASFYPMYEFAKQVAGGLAEVELLVPAGVEPHDWEPAPSDMKKIEEADALVYNGAGMESWIDQVLGAVNNDKLVKIEASHGIDVLESSEGHSHGQDEGEHAHEHGEEAGHEHEGEAEAHSHENHEHAEGEAHQEEGHEHSHDHDHGGLDPHVWLSPVLAIREVRNIEAGLSEAAPEHKEQFKKNADAYIAKLEQLDQEFKDGLADAKRKDFITQHAAFGYLAKAYGLTQVPIAGLSPDQEPSASRMAEIVAFAKEHKVKTILFETIVSSKVAETIAQEIGAKTAVLNPIEGLTDEDKAGNLDYIGIMRSNLAALKAALQE